MKHILLFVLLTAVNLKGQNFPYSFSQTAPAAYNEITDGTVSTATGNDGGENITLPFRFFYFGQPYTTARISVNGWLAIGNNYSGTGWLNDLASQTSNPLIAALWDDLNIDAQSQISYKTEGTAPSRVFVVQWKQVIWGGTRVNFQIRLLESDQSVKISFGSMNQPSGASASIGINDSVGGSGHFMSITPGNPPSVSVQTANNNVNTVTYLNFTEYNFAYTQQSPAAALSQITLPTTAGAVNQPVLKIGVMVSGPANPPFVTDFLFNTAGTTTPSDLAAAKIYYTGSEQFFTPADQYGMTVSSPSGDFTFTGSRQLNYGMNYFWLTYDITQNAVNGNFADAVLYSIAGIGAPDSQSVYGARKIIAGMQGVYQIGAGGQYTSLTNAVSALNSSALAGPVVFELTSGYSSSSETFPIRFGETGGSGGNNTITVRPASGVQPVTIEGSATAIFEFYKTEGIVFEGNPVPGDTAKRLIIINNQSTGNTLKFLSGNRNNSIRNCVIAGRNSSTTGGIINFMGNDTAANYNTSILSTRIQSTAAANSNTGIYVSGYYKVPSRGLEFRNLEIVNFHDAGIYLRGGTAGSVIENCSIYHTRASASSTVYGIRLDHAHLTKVSANKIWGLKTSHSAPSAVKGIFIIGGLGVNAYSYIYNNFISITDPLNCDVSGIDYYGYAENGAEIINNSIFLTGTGTLSHASAGIRKRAAAMSFEILNNIIVNERYNNPSASGLHYGIDITNSAGLQNAQNSTGSDFNNIYVVQGPQNYFGNWAGTNLTTLAFWKIYAQQDLNSGDKYIYFTSLSDLHLTGASLGDTSLKAKPLPFITTDIDGELRSLSAPYKGADENLMNPLPVELLSFYATVSEGEVTLTWETATETNNLGFEIERRVKNTDGEQTGFEKRGFIQGRGNSAVPVKYTFTDNAAPGKYIYRLKQRDLDGTVNYPAETEAEVLSPMKYSLKQNYPNPFNPSTLVQFSVPVNGRVKLMLYNPAGEEVTTLLDAELTAGEHKYELTAGKLSSGVYMLRMEAGRFSSVIKLMLLK
ncbi:MAG: T9SS type A sorting domain-containing protein [Ignavibacteriaceae bacterium]|nr:T9SS type A sorting domain-containing protein [Ignavibacteriaceae bacterium]